ncbi:pyridoxal phosphate-dependent aminotransferase [Gemmobacter serpentinus]|uniref:pyridoxal phosphate-dependent aminotransferase n=1 Tax=Gemmobacter serpentinus TaxID=2652247 RepID=UPI00124EFD7D|nr:pyridoxal phosphate-dependent aminotransferase [Gemmobacter serpentinus]
MQYASILDRLSGLGGAKWEIHRRARQMKSEGRAVIELTIGEPDVPCPESLMQRAASAMFDGRIGYSNGQGEPGLTRALAHRYSTRRGRHFGPENILCFPGTQTTLYAVLTGLCEAGTEVLVGDPMYATYEGLIRASGARPVPVPLRPERGFRLDPADLAAAVTPQSRVILLNTPHNPTGAVLSRADIAAIGEIARAHDLWIVSDEVYEDLVFPGVSFTSPLDLPDLADRSVACASISKSHAAPGFRSGWCVGSAEFCARLLPLSETMLFGNQPFIADMTAQAVSAPSEVAPGMVARFSARASLIHDRLHGNAGLRVHAPEAGMFALVDIRETGCSGAAFAASLLEAEGVATMPGESFGTALTGWLRLALSQPDALVAEGCTRIARHAATLRHRAA